MSEPYRCRLAYASYPGADLRNQAVRTRILAAKSVHGARWGVYTTRTARVSHRWLPERSCSHRGSRLPGPAWRRGLCGFRLWRTRPGYGKP